LLQICCFDTDTPTCTQKQVLNYFQTIIDGVWSSAFTQNSYNVRSVVVLYLLGSLVGFFCKEKKSSLPEWRRRSNLHEDATKMKKKVLWVRRFSNDFGWFFFSLEEDFGMLSRDISIWLLFQIFNSKMFFIFLRLLLQNTQKNSTWFCRVLCLSFCFH